MLCIITPYFIPTPPASIQSNAIVTTRAIDIFVLDKKHCIFTNTCRIHTRIGLLEPSLVGTLYLLHISNRGQSESATIDLGPRSWFQCDTDEIGESIQFHNELFHPCRLNDNTVLNGPNHLILHAHGANSCCASLHYFILHSNTTSIHSIQCHCHNKGNWYLCAWQKTLYLHQYMSHSHQDWLVGTLYLLHISNRGQSESATIDLGPRSWFQCDTDEIGESIQFHNELFHPCRLNDNTVLNGPNHLILHAHGANSCCASLHYFILHSNTTSIHSIQCHCHNKGNWYLCAWQKTLYLHQYMSHSHQDWLVGTLYLLHISNRGRSESATIDLGPRSWFQCDTDEIGESIQFHNELFHPCRLNDNTVLNGPNHLILHAHGANSCCASLHYFILHSNTTSIHSIQCHCHNKGNWYLCAWQKTLYLHQYMSHSHQDWLVGTLYLLHISKMWYRQSTSRTQIDDHWFPSTPVWDVQQVEVSNKPILVWMRHVLVKIQCFLSSTKISIALVVTMALDWMDAGEVGMKYTVI